MNRISQTGLIAVVVCAVALWVTPVQTARASITYVSQQRSIRVSNIVNGSLGGHTINAPNFQTFSEVLSDTFPSSAGGDYCAQTSSLLANGISVRSESRAQINSTSIASGASGTSECQVVFQLLGESPLFVTASHVSEGFGGSGSMRTATATLIGPTGTVFDWRDDFNIANSWPLAGFSGVVPPGQYSLRIATTSFVTSFANSHVVVAFDLVVPNPPCVLFLLTAASFLTRRSRTRE